MLLPKFKLEKNYNLVEALQSMGITGLFDKSSNMTGISDHRIAIDLVTSPLRPLHPAPGSPPAEPPPAPPRLHMLGKLGLPSLSLPDPEWVGGPVSGSSLGLSPVPADTREQVCAPLCEIANPRRITKDPLYTCRDPAL